MRTIVAALAAWSAAGGAATAAGEPSDLRKIQGT